jgi:hypothetical protein
LTKKNFKQPCNKRVEVGKADAAAKADAVDDPVKAGEVAVVAKADVVVDLVKADGLAEKADDRVPAAAKANDLNDRMRMPKSRVTKSQS